MDGENKGHGHVFERPDGVKARCGGPALCNECARDFYLKGNPPPKAMMALFELGHRLQLPNGLCLEKGSEDVWQVRGPFGGCPDAYWALSIRGSVPVGRGGSMDHSMKELADRLNGVTQ